MGYFDSLSDHLAETSREPVSAALIEAMEIDAGLIATAPTQQHIAAMNAEVCRLNRVIDDLRETTADLFAQRTTDQLKMVYLQCKGVELEARCKTHVALEALLERMTIPKLPRRENPWFWWCLAVACCIPSAVLVTWLMAR